ncbi:MAG: phosphopentomutase [Defluviitaleaceae bacterium]|nr:phosphopentomutase [Defluviitaleaceae bacterium]
MRVCIIVLDGVGIGELPDAAEYGDVGAHTLGNIFAKRGHLEIPNLLEMGLGNIENSRLNAVKNPTASYGRMAEVTRAKDTTSGHWEMMGLVTDPPFRVLEKFPESMLEEWLRRANRENKWLGNYPASGTEIIEKLGEEHYKTAAPIVYTSADSVFQVAAHEEIIPLNELYKLCEIAREMLVGDLFVGRVIARPFKGSAGAFVRTENRKDYAVPPTGKTLLDALEEKGQTTLGIGKIEDIFTGRGISAANHTKSNADGISATIEALKNNHTSTIIFTNLVDFDMKYGHRNDVEGFAKALEDFDRALPAIKAALRKNDVLVLSSDHGCDPTTPSTDHTREYAPILIHYKDKNVHLGTRTSFADLAATIYKELGHGKWPIGTPFF